MITTKSGKKSEGLQVEVEAYTKFSEDIDLDYANPIASSKSQLMYEMYMWDKLNPTPALSIADIYGGTTKGHNIFQNQKLNSGFLTMDDPEVQKLMNSSYKDQVKDLMLRKASSQNYNVSVRGQGEINTYALSVMYNTNNGIMKEDSDNNVLINFRNSLKVRDWMKLDFSVMNQIKNYNSGGIGFSDIKQMSAYETLLDENGNYNNITGSRGLNYDIVEKLFENTTGWPYESMINNPLQNMRSQDFNTKTISSRINTGLTIDIAEGIRYSAGFQYENSDVKVKNRYLEDSYFTRSTVNEFAVADYTALTEAMEGGAPYHITDQQIANGEIVYMQNTSVKSYLIRNQLSFDRTFGKHSINMIAGSELNWNVREGKDDWLYGYNHKNYTNVIPDSYRGLTRAFSNNQTRDLNRGAVLGYEKSKFFSLYSNLAYTYNDKYTLSGSIRTDASNITVEDPKYRYQPFWSLGASWQLSKEDFMESYDWINRLTLRATYGVNGNIPQATAQVPLIDYHQGGSFFSAGEDWSRIIELGNPTLGWEQVKQLNLAVDFALFGNKLFGSLEVYNKKSDDLVAQVALPSTDGTNSQRFNVAEMTNKGVELSLSANLELAKGLNWRPTLNFAHNDNMVESVRIVALPLYSLLNTNYVEGYALSPVWAYKLGEPDENGIPTIIGKNGVTYSVVAPIGNSGEFGPDVVWNKGSRIAPTIASLTNEFTYMGFSLLTTFTGKFGHVVNKNYFDYNTRKDTQNYYKDLDQIIEGNASEIGMFDLPDQTIIGYENLGRAAALLESNVVSGSHIRFKEVMLSYQLPKSFISKMKILQGAKVYAHVRNVGMIWKKNNEGIDPDYPMGFIKPERTYTLGLNLKF